MPALGGQDGGFRKDPPPSGLGQWAPHRRASAAVELKGGFLPEAVLHAVDEAFEDLLLSAVRE